ncbi:MAG: DUF167 domain-containing protein [Burkholderiales bacterium]|nr:DUF167 domain-containing protein [Burkholderiales bacterium]
MNELFYIKSNQLYINIYVQPGAKVSQLCGIHDNRLKLKVLAPPVDGAANKAVMNFFIKEFSLSKWQIEIVSGDKSRMKTVVFRQYTNDILEKIEEVIKDV